MRQGKKGTMSNEIVQITEENRPYWPQVGDEFTQELRVRTMHQCSFTLHLRVVQIYMNVIWCADGAFPESNFRSTVTLSDYQDLIKTKWIPYSKFTPAKGKS